MSIKGVLIEGGVRLGVAEVYLIEVGRRYFDTLLLVCYSKNKVKQLTKIYLLDLKCVQPKNVFLCLKNMSTPNINRRRGLSI